VSRIQATRAAAFLKKELGIDAVLVEGHYGELSVQVDGEEVIDGGALAFLGVLPSLERIRDAVAAKVGERPDPSAREESTDSTR
jgi:hypothetical protein